MCHCVCGKRGKNSQCSQASCHFLISKATRKDGTACSENSEREWDRSLVVAWRVSHRSHALARHAFQRPHVGFVAAVLDGTERFSGSVKEESYCSMYFRHDSFRWWQYVVSLYWFNANQLALLSTVIGRRVLPQFYITLKSRLVHYRKKKWTG